MAVGAAMKPELKVGLCDSSATPVVISIGSAEVRLSKAEGAAIIEQIAHVIATMFPNNP